MNDQLLKPTLAGAEEKTTPYSVRVGALSAFFGGVFAPIIWGIINSFRRRRAGRDWPAHAALICVACGILWAALKQPALSAWLTQSGVRGVAIRVAALGIFACEFLLHRTEHRHAETFGLKAPHGLGVGLLCIAASVALQTGGIALFLK